jgi:acid phosphatase type 7
MIRPLKNRWLIAGVCTAVLASIVLLRPTNNTEAAQGPDLQPFAHWVFSPQFVKGNTVDDRAGKLNGTIIGKPVLQADKPTACLNLVTPADGVSIQEKVTASAEFLPKEAFSMVAWVRIDQSTEWGGILSCMQDNGNAEKGVILGFNKEKFFFGLASKGADDGNGNITYLESSEKYELGRWYHVAGVYTGKQMQIFVNGKPSNQTNVQSGPVLYAESAPLVLGRYKDQDEDYPMEGALKEVLWCNGALPAERITAHFQAGQALSQLKPEVSDIKFVVEPYLQFGTQTSMTIMCETAAATSCTVEYGTSFPPKQTATTKARGTMHEIPLTNLQPKTKYFYRVVCKDAEDKPLNGKYSTFMTAVDVNDAYSFAIIGDTQKNPKITGKVAKLMWERRPNFVLHMGDVVDNGPDQKEWTDELFKPCQDLFSRVAVYPCIGNHEKNHAHYYKYFSVPKPEYYYSFKYGNAEFFSIDTNKSVMPGSEQYIWLDKALSASTAKWKVCYHHHPCYSSDSDDFGDTNKVNSPYGNIKHKPLITLYEKHNVDLALCGHIHLYERTWPIRQNKVDTTNGVIYITSGGGGGSLEDFEPTPAFYKNQGRVDYHFCYFNVIGGSLECKVFDHEGRLFDSFSVNKK